MKQEEVRVTAGNFFEAVHLKITFVCVWGLRSIALCLRYIIVAERMGGQSHWPRH